MKIEFFDSPVFKETKKDCIAYFRKLYDAAEVVWKYTENKHEAFKDSTRFKEAVEVAKNNGIDILQENIAEWGYSDLRQKIFQKLRLEGNKEAEQKLRVLNDQDFLPLEHFLDIFNTLYLTQHWEFTRKLKNNEFFPVWLQTANHVYDYKPKIKSGEDMEWAEEGDWLEENFFTNPRGLIRAVVYTESRKYEYNFQDIPAAKKLLETIKETSIKWGEAARATGFDFDCIGNGDQSNEDCLETAWNAAPEKLRNEHIKAIRQLTKEVWKYHQERLKPRIEARTSYPKEWVAPIDKVSSKAFNGMLNYGRFEKIALEKKGSKKEITTIINIDFDDLGKNVVLSGRKELEPFDRDVHDAIVSLYVGGNELITPQMIYQVLTGNPNVRLTGNRQKEISESITKCMFTRVDLDASEDAKAYGFENLKYQGSLIAAEKITAKLNGQVTEALRVFRPPILYEYADKKNQIARFDIKLLNTPVNKTREIITLQGYLQRRIVAMKGSKLSKNILYDTIYSQIQIEAETDGALKKKKSKIREQIREILNDWKAKEFIKDYKEETRGRELYSIKIELV